MIFNLKKNASFICFEKFENLKKMHHLFALKNSKI